MDVSQGYKTIRLSDLRFWYSDLAGPHFYITKTESWMSGIFDDGTGDLDDLSSHTLFGGNIGPGTDPLILNAFSKLYGGYHSDVSRVMTGSMEGGGRIEITKGFRTRGEIIPRCVIHEAEGYVYMSPPDRNETEPKYKVKIFVAVAFTTG